MLNSIQGTTTCTPAIATDFLAFQRCGSLRPRVAAAQRRPRHAHCQAPAATSLRVVGRCVGGACEQRRSHGMYGRSGWRAMTSTTALIVRSATMAVTATTERGLFMPPAPESCRHLAISSRPSWSFMMCRGHRSRRFGEWSFRIVRGVQALRHCDGCREGSEHELPCVKGFFDQVEDVRPFGG